MKGLYVSLLVMTLGYLSDTVHSFSLPFSDDEGGEQCMDKLTSCSKLGRKIPLSRCYDARHYTKCCETCDRLRLPLPDCAFGDRETFCSTIGKDKPTADCYAHNKTCCQTCHLYDSGIPGCPFGDRVTWCSGIGDRYSVQSCYDHEIHCCETCRQHRTGIPGCPYGDRVAWCHGIGVVYPIEYCASSMNECCQTCHRLQQEGYSFEDSDATTVPTTTREVSPLPEKTSPHIAIHIPTQAKNNATSNHNVISPTAPVIRNKPIEEGTELLTTVPPKGNASFLGNGSETLQHRDGVNQEVSEKETPLSRKPSINVTESITSLNETFEAISGHTVRGELGDTQNETSSTYGSQTVFPIYPQENGNPSSNSREDSSKNDTGFMEEINPTLSSNDLNTGDKTNKNNTIDPGGSQRENNGFKNSSAIDSIWSPVDTALHDNISQSNDNDLSSENQNAEKVSDQELVHGVSSGATTVAKGNIYQLIITVTVFTFLNIFQKRLQNQFHTELGS